MTELKLAGNKLECLPDLKGCSKVTSIDALGNRLLTVPPSVNHMHSLRELRLQGNSFRDLPPLEIPKLKWLLLHDNQLKRLPEFVLPSLEWLYVYNNRLTELPVRILQECPLKRLLVEGNPLSVANITQIFAHVNQMPAKIMISMDDTQLAAFTSNADDTAVIPPTISSGQMMHSNR